MTSRHQKFLTKRLALWGGGALVILVLLALALRPQPVPADFAVVERGPLRVTVDEEGETRVRDRFVISAPLPGKLLRIELEPGDPVRAGETVLATFLPSEPTLLDARSRAEARARVSAAEAALGRARAELERARAELRLSEAEQQRYSQLAEKELVSREQLDQVETTLETRRQGVEAAEFAARTAEHDLAIARAGLLEGRTGNPTSDPGLQPIAIRSPVDGTVLQRLRESEAVVRAGEPLVEVGDAHDLEIVSDLLSTDAVKVRAGQRVAIEQWGGDRPLEGVVRRVEPYGFTKISALGVEEQRVNVIVDFAGEPENRQALGDGYRVEVRIVVWQGDDVLKVPTSSLFRLEDLWAVWSVESGKAVLRPVEIGVRNGLEAQILSGLTEGERVVVHPSDAIREGIALEERTA